MKRGTRSLERGKARTETFSKKAPARHSALRVARSAFTLMEVLVVLALIALVGSLSLLDFGVLLTRAASPSPLETLTAAVDAARSGALNAGAPARLRFDMQTGSLRLQAGEASRDFDFATPAQVAFTLPADAAEGSERPLEALVFHPAGCALPAVIELTVGAERSRYRLEPFSGALTREESR